MSQNPGWIVCLQWLNWDAAFKIALAALLGAIVGLEREWGGHPAGLRTNMVIAISSCLFTILSIEGFPLQGSSQDTARVASQIVTGVGFLGAGVLLRTRSHIWGLTTAATIWLVAAIGMAIGTGAYFVAILTAILSTILLILLSVSRLPEIGRETANVNVGAWDMVRVVRNWLADHRPNLDLRDHQVIDDLLVDIKAKS